MNDFLVNLARRSAGLAPVIGSRPSAAPEESEAVPQQESDRGEIGAASPNRGAWPMAEARAIPLMPVPGTPDAPAVPAAAPPIAPVGAPLVQRVVAAAPPAPASAPAMPTPARDSIEMVAPRALDPLRPSEPPVAASLPSVVMPAVFDELPTAAQPASLVAVSPLESGPEARSPEPASPEPRLVERVITETRLVEPAGDTVRDHVIAGVSPALAPLAPMSPVADAPPERTVHVRIGAIEIHCAPTPLLASAAVAPPIAAVQAPSDTGFDRFARLRSYTPWDW